jgi:hypothetical protein
VGAECGLYDDPVLQAYVNEAGQKVARTSHQPGLAWRIAVLDRVKVEKIATTATLEATLRKPGAIENLFQTDAILNNLGTEETVMVGTLLKVVVPGKC